MPILLTFDYIINNTKRQEKGQEMGRRAYASTEAQNAANKRYYASSEEARLKRQRSNYKSSAKKFINDFADREELMELQEIIEKNLEKFL